jgi:hypothetical protein
VLLLGRREVALPFLHQFLAAPLKVVQRILAQGVGVGRVQKTR